LRGASFIEGYIGFTSLGYKHYTVNHSKNFKDPETAFTRILLKEVGDL